MILLQYRLVGVGVTDADEHGDPIRGRHFEFRFDDIVLPIKRYSHGTGQPLGGGCQKDIFYHAPMVAKGFSSETYSPFNCFDLNTGIMTYGASLSIVNCLGTA